MNRKRLGIVFVVAFLAALAAAAHADAPAGPRLAYMRFSLEPFRFELITSAANGTATRLVAGGGSRARPLPNPFSPPSWSPDGAQIVFRGLVGGFESRSSHESLFVVAADGGSRREIPYTAGAAFPVFSPDGHTIAFARERERTRQTRHGERVVYESASVWLVDLGGGAPRRITPWRNHLRQIPSSFSPDGSILAVTREAGDKTPEAIGLSFDGSASTVIARNASEPVFSPDGSRIALLRGPRRTVTEPDGPLSVRVNDLYTVNYGGGGLRRLTDTPRSVELMPRWDPSGQRLVYTRWSWGGPAAEEFGFTDFSPQVNADGSCRARTRAYPGAGAFGATWQPGPGREAGPIAC